MGEKGQWEACVNEENGFCCKLLGISNLQMGNVGIRSIFFKSGIFFNMVSEFSPS